MSDYIIGTNYWASHAGTNMWRDWNADVVADDLKILSENGIKYIRVFPRWDDFQPVKPAYSGGGFLYEYRMEDDSLPTNCYYLDEMMMARFSEFLEICRQENIKVVVGLITGFMSGRLFIPSVLYNKNLFSDSVALMFEQKFIKGFVSEFKHKSEIYAWDLGNECNCMNITNDRETAYSWVSMIVNAIRAQDNTRPVIAGTSKLDEGKVWNISDMAEQVDMLSTHPYPYWVEYSSVDKMSSMRTLIQGTCINKYHMDISGKPSIVEEIGTMGPMVCCEQTVAPGFARVNLVSNWAHKSPGMMWWCAFDQTNLKFPPYTWSNCEVELGMMHTDKTPKPVLNEFWDFANFLKRTKIELPDAREDAVCIVTLDQEQWGISYMTYVLAKQAKLNIRFSYCESDIPESNIYLMPSVVGNRVMNDENYEVLKKRVYEGATLYISNDNVYMPHFEQLTGLRVIDTDENSGSFEFNLAQYTFEAETEKRFILKSTSAEVLAQHMDNVVLARNKYGSGEVYYLNFPLEKNLINKSYAFDNNYYQIYNYIFSGSEYIAVSDNPYIGITEHIGGNEGYIVAINYSGERQKLNLSVNCSYEDFKIIKGNIDFIDAYDYVVLKLEYGLR